MIGSLSNNGLRANSGAAFSGPASQIGIDDNAQLIISTMQFRTNTALFLMCLLMVQGAASAGETEYNLGVHAYRTKDYASARQHWQNAVVQGDSSAMNNLGFLLYNGLGGPLDASRAVALWTAAAKAGHSESQWHLADAFERGKGTASDLVEAYAWYRCALVTLAAETHEEGFAEMMVDAKSSMIKLLDLLPEDKVAAAESRARAYIKNFTAKPIAGTQGSAGH